MKRTLAIALALLVAAPAFAEVVNAPSITASAAVSNTFTISVDLRRDAAGFPDIANNQVMAFGTLVPNPGNGGTTLVAAEGIMAFVSANSHRDPYTISSNIVNPLTSGTFTIPSATFVLNAAYAAADNGGLANEGTANYSGTAVGTHTIYTSGGTHSMRAIQAHYTITDDPALGVTGGAFVPLDQPDGTYQTTLVISATR